MCPYNTQELMNVKDIIDSNYGDKLRVRICAIVTKNEEILLLKHKAKTPTGYLWLPPGGGLEFGETIEEALTRETLEETGLNVTKKCFYDITEHVSPPLHAIEIFYTTNLIDGKLTIGKDPELTEDNQLIVALKWMSLEEVKNIENSEKHQILKDTEKLKTLFKSNHKN